MTRIQAQILIDQFDNLNINQQVHVVNLFNYVIIPFEGNIHPGDPQGIKIYRQETKEIEKEAERLDVSVSNDKDIIDHFLSIANKYGWGFLAFMVDTSTDAKTIFRQVDQIQISEMHHQSHGCFLLQGIVNVVNQFFPTPLMVSDLLNLCKNAQEVKKIHDRVRSDMIAKTI